MKWAINRHAPGHIVYQCILAPRAHHFMGHIVSEGMKSLGHVVYRTECLRGMLYPGADCHCSRLSSGQIVSGVLSPWHIVSGAHCLGSYFLRGGFSVGRMVCESDGLWDGLSAGRIVCGANCLGPCEHRCLEAKLPSPKLNHWNPSLKFSNLADWILFQKITTTRPQHNGSNI